ncbi:MAG: hypothetical protein JSV98_10765 [candidate division WOR-3 bacterium]|nr:MAG: hypothetical protein JSV98_10765 [candidate division WOR-3 bacterium]
MRKILAFLVFVCITIFLVECGGEDEVEHSYYPLNIGNEWNYEVTMTVEIPGTSYNFTGASQDQITGTTQLTGGASVFQFATALTLNGFSGNDTFYIHETDTAVYLYEDVDDTLPDKYLEFPLAVGNTWTVNATQSAQVLGSVDISVPAGDYSDCWEIAYTEGEDTILVYLAYGVGEVKGYAVSNFADTTVTLSLELESTTIQ